jgi:two-component system KDP operon response regulator KdpE
LVDFDGREARDGDDVVHLTHTEWQLLDVLVRNPGKLISQRQLLQEVWGPTYLDQTQYLRQYLAQLRRKLEDDPARPQHLLTEPGMGYRFRPRHRPFSLCAAAWPNTGSVRSLCGPRRRVRRP